MSQENVEIRKPEGAGNAPPGGGESGFEAYSPR